ncbi:MAG: S-methyl-5-thioribose-1-phosphate isomerase [Hyphomicrobiales bacterium]
MKIDGIPHRSIWVDKQRKVMIIDQTKLPHEVRKVELTNMNDAARAIKDMLVRGAPLIGATAAYGIALALREDSSNDSLEQACETLAATRPTAINLRWAIDRMSDHLKMVPTSERADMAFHCAEHMCDEDVEINRKIGEHGLKIIKEIAEKKNGPVNILTHCNAGWIATVDWGTATSPIYQAHDLGIDVHVWVDETRPRNQGAHLTAWELGSHGVSHSLIVDNAGGHLMQHGLVDLCITGTDRVTSTGDVCNKIGTYLKALAAHDNNIPFYVALPSPTIDWNTRDGVKEIPIEQRSSREVAYVQGLLNGKIEEVRITPETTPCSNYAFDVTPSKYVTGLITERGICKATEASLADLFPDLKP